MRSAFPFQPQQSGKSGLRDFLAMDMAYWVEQITRDNEQAVKDIREEELQKELDKFIDHVLGHSQHTSKWVNLACH